MGEPRPRSIENRQTSPRVRFVGALATVAVGTAGLGASSESQETPVASFSMGRAISSQETQTACPPKKIVVLGSSTAAGVGASQLENAWVSRYERYFTSQIPGSSVDNRAVAGTTTYEALPSGSPTPEGKPKPDPQHNITFSLAEKPDGIIAAYTSNDIANGSTPAEVEANLWAIERTAEKAHVPIWIATQQPRTRNFSETKRKMLGEINDWIHRKFAVRVLDFWSSIAEPDGKIKRMYAAGDGVHLNDAGHTILFKEVIKNEIPTTLCTIVPGRLQK